jgi:stage II sporulation protein R
MNIVVIFAKTSFTEEITMKKLLKNAVCRGRHTLQNAARRGRRALRTHILDLSMLIGAVAAIAISGFTAFALECERIPQGVLRLHIIAESNSPEDQQFKYELRDFILENFASQLQDFDSVEQSIEKSRELLPEIEEKSQEFANRSISAEIVGMYFPTRRYDTGTLPAGNYTALRITIGEGQGENWWCVMFPALCIPAVSENQAVPVISIPESVTDSPRVKFAVFEFFNNLFR